MAEKKIITEKESLARNSVPSKKETKVSAASGKKIKDLKIELLKNPTKKKSIKKEIARLLTMARSEASRGVGIRGVGVSDIGTTGNWKGKETGSKTKTKLNGGNK